MLKALIFFVLLVFFNVSLNAYEIKYDIIKSQTFAGKKSFDVRIHKELTKDDLEHIALEIRNSEKNKKEFYHFLFYLPKMRVDAGAWASVNLKEKGWYVNTDVRIVGITAEDQIPHETK